MLIKQPRILDKSIPLSYRLNFLSPKFLKFLTSIVNEKGGVYFPFQETSGLVAQAVNPALALGRNLALNNEFTDWAGSFPNEIPDKWTMGGSAISATNYVAEVGAGIRFVSDGNLLQVVQNLLIVGKTYKITIVVDSVASGGLDVDDSFEETFASVTTPGTHIFNGTANSINATIKRVGACDLVVSSVLYEQTNILASTAFPGSEELSTAGDGTSDKDNWTAVSDAILTNPSTNLLRITYDGTANPRARQVGTMTIGKRYRLTAETRSDGNLQPRALVSSAIFTGTTSTDWQVVNVEFVSESVTLDLISLAGAGSQFTEWRNITLTEANPLNGDITGATINQSAGSPLIKSYLFDGALDFVGIHSAEINSIFDPTKGTLLCFAKVSGAGVWEDGTTRRIVFGLSDASNQFNFSKTTANNAIQMVMVGGGVTKFVTDTSLNGTLNYFMIAMTWDTGADALIAYVNGVKVGNTQTGLGTWVGNLDPARVLIGSSTQTPTSVWDGFETHTQLLTEVLTPAEILEIATKAGTL